MQEHEGKNKDGKSEFFYFDFLGFQVVASRLCGPLLSWGCSAGNAGEDMYLFSLYINEERARTAGTQQDQQSHLSSAKLTARASVCLIQFQVT